MGEYTDGDMTFAFFLGVIVTVVVLVLFGGMATYLMSMKTTTVKGSITDIDFSSVNDPKYMTVTFDNGQKYNINIETTSSYDSFLDLTDNSVFLLKLQWSSGWLSPNTDNTWGIVQILKYDKGK